MRVINPKWQEEMRSKIEALKDGGDPIDETTSFNKAINWFNHHTAAKQNSI